MKRIILCGLPGCGKTSTGLELAKILSTEMIDIDLLIEKRYAELAGERLTCRQIFSQKGESFFRELEKEAIVSLVKTANHGDVIATGGGALEFPENVKMFKSIGLIVYLKVQFQTVYDRLLKKGLPSYLDPKDPLGSFEKITLRRVPIYLNAADLIIETDGLTPAEVASEVIDKVRGVV